MEAFRTISDLLSAPPRNDIEALGVVMAGYFLVQVQPVNPGSMSAVFMVAFLVLCSFVFERWHARLQ